MTKVTPPSNKKKRLYKMVKHLGNPQERWWEIDAAILSYERWLDIFGTPLGTAQTGFTEIQMRQWVDGVHSIGFDKERTYWLGVYRDVYLPLVERVMTLAQDDGFGFKTLSSVYVGSRNFPVWADCWIAPCGVAVFTESRATDAVGARLPTTLRSAFRPAPSVDVPAWCMADYYRHRSEKYAEKFDLSLSGSGEGWSLGDVTESVDVSRVREVLSRDGEVLGRALLEWVLANGEGG
jgi:hypothetical protein